MNLNFTLFILIITHLYIYGQAEQGRDIHLLDNDYDSHYRDKIDFYDENIFARKMLSPNNRFRLAPSDNNRDIEIRDTQEENRLVWNANINTFFNYDVGSFNLGTFSIYIRAQNGIIYGSNIWESKFTNNTYNITNEYAKRISWGCLAGVFVLSITTGLDFFTILLTSNIPDIPFTQLLGKAFSTYFTQGFFSGVLNFSHRYHNELILSNDDGHIEIYHLSNWPTNLLVELIDFPPAQLIYSTRDNRHRLLYENTNTLKDFIENLFPDYEVSSFLESEEQNKKVFVVGETERWFLMGGKVYDMNDFNQQHTQGNQKIEVLGNLNPIIDLFDKFPFSSDPQSAAYFYINPQHGGVEVRNLLDNSITETKGSNCLKVFGDKYKLSLEETSDEKPILRLYNKDQMPLWNYTHENKVVCEFPTMGQSSLNSNNNLIHYNQQPNNKNELTYLLSSDGSKITIILDGKLKVIHKSQFNGDFETSPAAIQPFNLTDY